MLHLEAAPPSDTPSALLDLPVAIPAAERRPNHPSSHARLASPKVRLINALAIVLPFAGLIAAMVMLWGVAFSWVYLALLVTMVFATGFGITVGYHRLFTHRSFETPKPIAHLLAILGSMAVQGPLLEWVATHRKHHQHSDDEGDPHSPHGHGDDFVGIVKGLWHAHMGWLFLQGSSDLSRYSGDLRRDAALRRTSDLFVVWVVLGLVLPAVIAGLVTQSWMGVLLGFIWGGLVRVFLVHHITWSINSVCHLWGARPFPNEDESRNNVVFGVLAFGEGWHNNHHAFPTSARHGLWWWQFDMSYLLIQAMAAVGLARKIKVPTQERIAEKLAEQ